MELNSLRELRAVDPEWSIAELMSRLAKALIGDGPALAFGNVASVSAPARVAVVVATSGSTGEAKEVGISASALLASAKASNKFLGATFGQTWSLLLPLTHIAGINVLVRGLELGTIPIDLTNVTGKYPHADFTAIVPTQLFRALNGDARLLTHLQSAQGVLVGGATLRPELKRETYNLGINVITTYGMTETSGGCVYNGTVLDCAKVEISPDGLIKIAGPILATTYLNKIDLWHERCVDGWFTSTDLGAIEAGQLVIRGRADDVIITGGENVSLGAIEASLAAKFPDSNFVAFAIEDQQWGEQLHIAVTGLRAPAEFAISEHLAHEFGATAKPKGILYLEEFPLRGIGKIDHSALAKIQRAKQ